MGGLEVWRSRPALGSGQFATVYRAVDTDSGETFAAKIFEAEGLDPDMAARLCEREHSILRATQGPAGGGHRNVLRMVARVGPDTLLLGLAPHGDLLTLLQHHANVGVPGPQAAAIVEGVLHGLEYLHSTVGIMHGDLKPENTLLADGDGGGGRPWRPVLADFDAAIELGTRLDPVRGTADYLPPEYAAAVAVTVGNVGVGTTTVTTTDDDTAAPIAPTASAATDVWAAGMLCVATIAGVHAWNVTAPPAPSSSSTTSLFWHWRAALSRRDGSDPAPADLWAALPRAGGPCRLILAILTAEHPADRPSAAAALELARLDGADGVTDGGGCSTRFASDVDAFHDAVAEAELQSCCLPAGHRYTDDGDGDGDDMPLLGAGGGGRGIRGVVASMWDKLPATPAMLEGCSVM